jgi:predicted PurR-regulated permease PerM
MNLPQPPVHVAATAVATRTEIASWIIAGVALVLVLRLHLLPGLLAGLLVFELVHIIAPRLRLVRVGESWQKLVAIALLAAAIVLLVTAAIVGTLAFFRSDAGSLSALLAQMADILEGSRDKLPGWVAERLPENALDLQDRIGLWLRENAWGMQSFGAKFGIALVHILIGLVIGALVTLGEVRRHEDIRPLAKAMGERVRRLGEAFRRVVFAQVRISALNTTLTAIYLVVVLPLLGVHLPFTKTMILVTFVAGLLPVIGNLISNTVITIISLSYSVYAAVGSLAYLVLIHKLEYFVNARIIGGQIRARAWELLTAMLVMEAAFGVAGVIAAPIFYAYVKDELKSRGLI